MEQMETGLTIYEEKKTKEQMMAEAIQEVMINKTVGMKNKMKALSAILNGGTADDNVLVTTLLNLVELLPRNCDPVQLSTFNSRCKETLTIECRFQLMVSGCSPATQMKVIKQLSKHMHGRYNSGDITNISIAGRKKTTAKDSPRWTAEEISVENMDHMWKAFGRIDAKTMPKSVRDRFTMDKKARKSWSTMVEESVDSAVHNSIAMVQEIISRFNDTAKFYMDIKISKKGKSAAHGLKRIDYSPAKKNPLSKRPLGLNAHSSKVEHTPGTVQCEAFDIARNMQFTMDTDYNKVMTAFIEDDELFNKVAAGKKIYKEQSHLDAKIKSYKASIKNPIKDWAEIDNAVFWNKWNVDFRGRLYQQGDVTAINHKAAKSMLRSGKGMALGVDGYEAILMGLASAMGYDKAVWSDRMVWAAAHEAECIEIGKLLLTEGRQLEGMKALIANNADDVFQAMVCCIEVARIEAFEGNRSDYISNIFIGYDGSCSGLQNIGCMTRNKALMEGTNVWVDENTEDKIYDIYLVLNDEMIKACHALVNDPDVEAMDKTAAEFFLGLPHKMKRTICKRLLMKRSYGAAYVTMFKSIRDEIYTTGCIEDFGEALELSKVLAKVFGWIYDGGDVFKSAKEYERLTKDIAAAYTAIGEQMTWTLNIGDGTQTTVEPQRFSTKYRTSDARTLNIMTSQGSRFIQDFGVNVAMNKRSSCEPKSKLVLNAKRVESGACPNLTHTCDSTHLSLTIVNLDKIAEGTAFALCHDCVGVVPGLARRLRTVLKQSWLAMYSNHNILEQVIADCNERTGSELKIEDYDINPPRDLTDVIEATKYSYS